jgi:hypothetical protein
VGRLPLQSLVGSGARAHEEGLSWNVMRLYCIRYCMFVQAVFGIGRGCFFLPRPLGTSHFRAHRMLVSARLNKASVLLHVRRCLKYLPKFKWDHLTEEINYQKAVCIRAWHVNVYLQPYLLNNKIPVTINKKEQRQNNSGCCAVDRHIFLPLSLRELKRAVELTRLSTTHDSHDG